MATIAALTENFNGGTNGGAITTSNSFFTNVGATQLLFTNSDPIEGTLSARTNGTTSHLGEVSFTAVTTLWFNLYFKPTAWPTANTAFLAGYGNGGVNKVFDVRLTPSGTIQLRSDSTARWTSTAINLNEWHRIAIGLTPVKTTIQARIYSGSDLHGTTPTQSSGNQSNTNTTATNIDLLYFGLITADSTAAFQMDRVRGDDAAEPAAIAGGATISAVTATSSAAAVAPAASGTASVTGVAATASSTARAPVAGVVALVTAVTATATALALGGTAQLVTILSGAGPVPGTAVVYPPTVGISDSETAVVATASALARVPVVNGITNATIAAVRAISTAAARPVQSPFVSSTVTVDSSRATAFGVIRIPDVQTTIIFTCPTYEEPIRTRVEPLLHYRMTYASSLVKVEGQWRSVRNPSAELLDGLVEGQDFFRGGYEYPVSQALRNELASAGY